MSGDPRGTDDDGERSLVLAVRQAVQGDDVWSADRASFIAAQADRRAARRRRRRLVVAPAALLAAAAAVATGLAVFPAIVTAEGTSLPAAGRPAPSGPSTIQTIAPDPAVVDAAEAAGRLFTAEVQWVIPGAAAQLSEGAGESGADLSLDDACATAVLPVTGPIQRETATWKDTLAVQTFKDASANAGPAPQAVTTTEFASLTSQVDTYADATQARAAVDALRESARTCTPAPGESQPSSPFVQEMFRYDVLLGSAIASAPGHYRVMTAGASGAHVAVISAIVNLSNGSEEDVARQQVGLDLERLARVAAARADSRPGTEEPVDLARTPVTTADVDAVLPGAQPMSVYAAKLSLDSRPRDACGTDPLTGVADLEYMSRGAWSDPHDESVDFGVDGQKPTAMGLADVVVITNDFASPADAQAYATAYQGSASTCLRGDHVLPPAPVDLLPAGAADALLTNAYDEVNHRHGYAAVVVRGSTAATVLAWVPGEASRVAATQAAQRVVTLASQSAAVAEAQRNADAASAAAADAAAAATDTP
ncbi:hypothetical protein SAMN06264364_101200 [Quadrisphaera granulorum]|uniref:Uncharacterized protein n=1 Tax=Quadrisphaera granulorum TaxID=317664 RepID=A0A316AEL7_9ACTN|nr:hypothetical protein [Quadrisphaera granulorum]PWJ56225.1 hypothetical protein BXY45_101200 [Quadrisphaera granulorum]SZE94859.1 hypothetical protein SAMN06264364_101200 [Quadrisphaera granulorum]